MTKAPSNSIEAKAAPFLKRYDNLDGEINDLKAQCKEQCAPLKDDQKDIVNEAERAGVPKKAFRGLIKHRALSRKQVAIAGKMDMDEAAAYQHLVDALGPLGEAAARRAGYPTQDGTRPTA